MVNPFPPKPRGKAAARRKASIDQPDRGRLTGESNADRDFDGGGVGSSDAELAKEALRAILRDDAAPAAARAQAARTLAEMVGALGRHSKPQRDDLPPLGEMTRQQLEAELAGLE